MLDPNQSNIGSQETQQRHSEQHYTKAIYQKQESFMWREEKWHTKKEYTTYIDRQFNVLAEIDRTHDIVRMTNKNGFIRVMKLPKYTLYNDMLVDWKQYENEMHNWSKQAFNDCNWLHTALIVRLLLSQSRKR